MPPLEVITEGIRESLKNDKAILQGFFMYEGNEWYFSITLSDLITSIGSDSGPRVMLRNMGVPVPQGELALA